MSFGSKVLPTDKTGPHFFSATNHPLSTLFQDFGIRHRRMGGTCVQWPTATPIADETDIGIHFAFVKAAQVQKVIYSFRLFETRPGGNYAAPNTDLARYVWAHYRFRFGRFAVGDECDRFKVCDQDLSNTAWRVGHALRLHTAKGYIQNHDNAMKLWRFDCEPGLEART